jgi:hypothetical protein
MHEAKKLEQSAKVSSSFLCMNQYGLRKHWTTYKENSGSFSLKKVKAPISIFRKHCLDGNDIKT